MGNRVENYEAPVKELVMAWVQQEVMADRLENMPHKFHCVPNVREENIGWFSATMYVDSFDIKLTF